MILYVKTKTDYLEFFLKKTINSRWTCRACRYSNWDNFLGFALIACKIIKYPKLEQACVFFKLR